MYAKLTRPKYNGILFQISEHPSQNIGKKEKLQILKFLGILQGRGIFIVDANGRKRLRVFLKKTEKVCLKMTLFRRI